MKRSDDMKCTKNNFAYPNYCKCEKCKAFRLGIAGEITPIKEALVIFNDGSSCFVKDDGCYVLKNFVNGEWVKSAHLFDEAVKELIKIARI